jgi:hypothetical protein
MLATAKPNLFDATEGITNPFASTRLAGSKVAGSAQVVAGSYSAKQAWLVGLVNWVPERIVTS